MTRSELINLVSGQVTGLTKAQTEVIIDTFFQSLTSAFQNGEKVEIRGFGIFKLKTRPARIARNPKTGAKVDVTQKKLIHFKMGKEFKDLLNPGGKTEE
ncbi:MAG: integration host factor subunit beta [Nitrospirae bacterium]|nr:integration host factor subunit beta [Nitrospirota bacterium]